MASDSGNWRSRAAGPSSSRDDGPPRASGGGGLRGDGWRSGGGSGGGGGDNWRGGGGASASRPAGERPRLNLKARGAGGAATGGGSSAPPTEKLSNLSTLDNKEPPSNSRAAAFGAAPSGGVSGMRREPNKDRRSTPAGPPPVANSRFSKLAEEDRGRGDDRRNDRRRDDPYSAPRGPPPPVVNSRFAAAAEADRASAPPAPAPAPRGPPPPVANSRFAAAAAMAEQDNAERQSRFADRVGGGGGYGDRGGGERGGYGDRGGGYGGGGGRDNRGPPPEQQNSRFARAVAADSEYLDRDSRTERDRDRAEQRMMGGGRGGYGDRGGRGGGGGFRMGDLPRGPAASRMDDLPKGPQASREDAHAMAGQARVDELIKMPTQKKEQAPLEPISKEHEGNILQMPVKALKKDEEELILGAPKKEKETPAPAPAPKPPASNVNVQEYLDEFVSGNKLGEDLKAWVEENRANLPMPDKIVFHLLVEKEKLNPDPDCAWAEPDKYGAALLTLCEDDIVNQMHVLWGIQFYCDKMGFPKINEEYLVQSMFRSMYKHDLAETDAFLEWKEDETEYFEKGKLKAVIQTTEWFAWLEEDDEESEEEEEEYED